MKNQFTQEEIDVMIAERLKEYEEEFIEDHTAKVEIKYGNIYVVFNVQDSFTEKSMIKIKTLLDLMKVKYSINIPILSESGHYYLTIINDDDKAKADFIQKFIDNGYILTC